MEEKIPSNCKSFGCGIVLIGDYSPTVFQPAWFKDNGLLQAEEADKAKINVIHPDICQFLAGAFKITVERNRIVLETSDQSYLEPLKDLALSIATLFNAVPVKRAGVNYSGHFQCKSEEVWHAVGHEFTPKNFWNEILDSPGMTTLTVQGKSEISEAGYIRIRVEPSVLVKFGVFAHINNHMTFADAKDAKPFLDALSDNWKKGLDAALAKLGKIGEKIKEIEGKI